MSTGSGRLGQWLGVLSRSGRAVYPIACSVAAALVLGVDDRTSANDVVRAELRLISRSAGAAIGYHTLRLRFAAAEVYLLVLVARHYVNYSRELAQLKDGGWATGRGYTRLVAQLALLTPDEREDGTRQANSFIEQAAARNAAHTVPWLRNRIYTSIGDDVCVAVPLAHACCWLPPPPQRHRFLQPPPQATETQLSALQSRPASACAVGPVHACRRCGLRAERLAGGHVCGHHDGGSWAVVAADVARHSTGAVCVGGREWRRQQAVCLASGRVL